ncbi:MAG: hypothetical protein Q8906_10965 [Bacillota bacterium]|nr:hypothetical protein [Bacillota bacterium]
MNEKKKVIFGLKVGPVENSLAERKRVHEQLLLDRQQDLDAILEETKALEIETAELDAASRVQAPRSESSYHANMTMPLTISWLQIQAEEEIQKIEKKFRLQKAEYEKEIDQLTQTIENGKKFMDSLIDQFSKTIENFHHLDQADYSLANVLPFTLPLEGLNEASSTEETYFAHHEVIGSNYWDGIDSLVSSPLPMPQAGNGTMIEGMAADAAGPQQQLFGDHQVNLKPIAQEVKEPEVGASVESPAINQELESIKKRYIVGKVAGSDLFDDQGALIVAKQTEITGEIVEKANRAGVLADLIVHMKIPDLSETHE